MSLCTVEDVVHKQFKGTKQEECGDYFKEIISGKEEGDGEELESLIFRTDKKPPVTLVDAMGSPVY